MEESANRYFLIMFLRDESKTFYNEQEAKDFVNKYKKTNKNENSTEVYGKLVALYHPETKTWTVEYPVYKKITKKYSLEEADFFTSNNFDDEASLKNYFSKYIGSETGEISIGYMMNGEVRTLPILYVADKMFGSYEDIKTILIERAADREFVVTWLSNKIITNLEYKKDSIICAKRLNEAYGRFWRGKETLQNIRRLISDFVIAYCISKGKTNQRLVRELGSIVKDTLNKLGEEPNLKSRLRMMEGF